jgi:hypothetical protein
LHNPVNVFKAAKFLGFAGAAIAFQLAFLIMASYREVRIYQDMRPLRSLSLRFGCALRCYKHCGAWFSDCRIRAVVLLLMEQLPLRVTPPIPNPLNIPQDFPAFK